MNHDDVRALIRDMQSVTRALNAETARLHAEAVEARTGNLLVRLRRNPLIQAAALWAAALLLVRFVLP